MLSTLIGCLFDRSLWGAQRVGRLPLDSPGNVRAFLGAQYQKGRKSVILEVSRCTGSWLRDFCVLLDIASKGRRSAHVASKEVKARRAASEV